MIPQTKIVNKMFLLGIVSCLLLLPHNANSQILNKCVAKSNSCQECIQTKGCQWCMEPDFDDRLRCFDPTLTTFKGGCKEQYSFDASNQMTFIEQKELTKAAKASGSMAAGGSAAAGSAGAGKEQEITQIYPQRVQMKLRINEAQELQVKYSQAVDYPVDLYYLMDLSKSMEDDKEKLSSLGNLLSDEMMKITSNFRLGFGSFVDKVLMPYVSTVPKKLEAPCTNCAAPYGYKNHMALSLDTKKFSEEVAAARVSGNLDAPEGGFDAIMQAVVCRDIGWREKARRLLLFSTDAGFHYAGDGKLGGVITPNDGTCHLDQRGMYTHSTIQDYPSISQVNLKVKENAINVIFAVTQQQIDVYAKLAKHIEGSSAAILSNDSSNIVQLVQQEYNKISSSVEMRDNATSFIKVKYFSACLDGEMKERKECKGLKVGDVVSFKAEITAESCPPNRKDWKQLLQIYPVGISESLMVELEMICDCGCNIPGHPTYEEKSLKCNGQGTYKCGVCACDDQHSGRKCECSLSDVHSESEMDSGCRPDNTTTTDCGGRGTCVCGVCECEKRQSPNEMISGKYCECDNFSCERANGLICSGSDHGECVCGECECQQGWTGSDCSCRATTETCMPRNGGDICSGHGDCVCGGCICHVEKEGRYSGRFCEKCPTCSGRCAEFKDCVQCQMYHTGNLKAENDCADNCTLFTPLTYEVVVADEEKDEHLCTFYDEDDCRFSFVYNDMEEKVVVKAQKERECPPKVFMLGIVLAVIAAIVLIGMAILLLWKLLTTIHDRREFARFEKERMMAKWDTGENPIYKQATSTFKNPTYAGK